jgi:hypothetical protein
MVKFSKVAKGMHKASTKTMIMKAMKGKMPMEMLDAEDMKDMKKGIKESKKEDKEE